MKHGHDAQDRRNLLLAVLVSAVVLVAWQLLYEGPRRQQIAQQNALERQRQEQLVKRQEAALARTPEAVEANLPREERLKRAPRLPIRSDALHGSIALKGLRFDDLTLARYRSALAPNSPDVVLLTPLGDPQSYFAEIGWIAAGGQKPRLPDSETLWRTEARELSPDKPATFRWDNGEGLTFLVTVSLDENYMFSIEQQVENRSGRDITLIPYALVNRAHQGSESTMGVLHEGAIGVVENRVLKEIYYDKLQESEEKYEFTQDSGWLGFTDKYWLTALIPGSGTYKTTFEHYKNKQGVDRFQASYTGGAMTAETGGKAETSLRLFAGAKELDALDAYAEGKTGGAPIPLFDRAVDFGVLYFLTKPLFLLLDALYAMVGNFGVAILILTLLVKLLMYPMATKSYRASSQMRALQPEVERIRKSAGDDRLKLQQEIMQLYKTNKVNPASGCLPILIQLPVFFALYKVLFVTIEMRHAPFFGWLRDLSAADPSNIFTLFGLIPWTPPSFLHLGILPILMCASMAIQMKQQPQPTDPTQAKVMQLMPYMMLIIFAKMPAGLVLYWTFSNVLSIAQQAWISRHTRKKRVKKPQDGEAVSPLEAEAVADASLIARLWPFK